VGGTARRHVADTAARRLLLSPEHVGRRRCCARLSNVATLMRASKLFINNQRLLSIKRTGFAAVVVAVVVVVVEAFRRTTVVVVAATQSRMASAAVAARQIRRQTFAAAVVVVVAPAKQYQT
jgi:hypothetical protein